MSETTPTPPSEPTAPAVPPVSPYTPPAAGPARPTPILSILSLIGGIVGLVLACCFGAGFLFSLAGVILGHLGLKREPAGRGLAIGGLVTGYIGLAINLFVVISLVLAALGATLPFLALIPWLATVDPSTYSY